VSVLYKNNVTCAVFGVSRCGQGQEQEGGQDVLASAEHSHSQTPKGFSAKGNHATVSPPYHLKFEYLWLAVN